MRNIFHKGISLKEAIIIARPFWWVNTCMPFVASYFIIGHRHDLTLFLGIIYFAFVYNFFMYGINDIFDYESDIRNPRKTGIDGSVMPKTKHASLWFWIVAVNLPITLYFYLQGDMATNLWFSIMIFMVIAYSLGGLRFKERPVLDSFTSSFHYTSPFIYGGLLAGNANLYIGGFITFFIWVMSNHALGAIMDITPDKEAKIKSIATELGSNITTLLVFGGYCLAAVLPVLLYGLHGLVGSLVLSLYVYYVAKTLPYRHNDKHPIFPKTWRLFLYTNYAAGFVITFALLLGFKPFGRLWF